MTVVRVNEGGGPIILTFPHGGVHIPDAIKGRLNSRGLDLADTDWHIHRLYDDLLKDATSVQAVFHRYVVDANRDPEGSSLYPGQNTTDLCPLTDFEGKKIWRPGQEPDATEVAQRRQAYHGAYHGAVAQQIARVKERHGIALVYDCHSIRSKISYLFDGTLPDFNIGTHNGASCGPKFESAAVANCRRANRFTHVLNGRFKGGWTIRHYGKPENGVHAMQMELAQSTYMTERAPWTFDDEKAQRLRKFLYAILANLENLALERRL